MITLDSECDKEPVNDTRYHSVHAADSNQIEGEKKLAQAFARTYSIRLIQRVC